MDAELMKLKDVLSFELHLDSKYHHDYSTLESKECTYLISNP